jgi:uncharacterized protein (DUF305 family)
MIGQTVGATRHHGRFVRLVHQEEAVQRARWETGSGAHQEVKDLADRIDRSRTAQIGTTKKFLDRA